MREIHAQAEAGHVRRCIASPILRIDRSEGDDAGGMVTLPKKFSGAVVCSCSAASGRIFFKNKKNSLEDSGSTSSK